jgi:hypothetical protein
MKMVQAPIVVIGASPIFVAGNAFLAFDLGFATVTSHGTGPLAPTLRIQQNAFWTEYPDRFNRYNHYTLAGGRLRIASSLESMAGCCNDDDCGRTRRSMITVLNGMRERSRVRVPDTRCGWNIGGRFLVAARRFGSHLALATDAHRFS